MPRVVLLSVAFAAGVIALPSNHSPLAAQDKKKAPKLALAKVGAVPEGVRAQWKIDPMYTKYADASGIPVIGTKKVTDRALAVAAWVTSQMFAERPDVAKTMAEEKIRVVVIGATESVLDIPEYKVFEGKAGLWNAKGRGLSGNPSVPVVSCGEENLLGLPGDSYRGQVLLISLLGVTAVDSALSKSDAKFETKLAETYDAAMKKKLWDQTFAAKEAKTYWSNGVQAYFDAGFVTNRPDGVNNGVSNNALLKKYDPALYALIDETLKSPKWRWGQPIPAK